MPIPLIGPDGRRYEMDDPAKVAQAVELGYRPVTDAAPETLGETVLGGANEATDTLGAAVQGLGQGVTAGLLGAGVGAPQHAGESDEDYKTRRYDASEMLRRKEEHPLAAGVGEFAGMVASPVGLVGKGITKALGATTALGRIGTAVAAGGTEGMLFGAGNTMSDAALGDQDLTGEKMVAGIGLGGLLGAGGAGVLSGLAESVKAVAPVVGRALLGSKNPIQDFADNRWIKAAGATQTDVKAVPDAERPAVANVIREAMQPSSGVLPKSLDEAAAGIARERDATSAQLLKEAGLGDAGGLTPTLANDEAKVALGKGFQQQGARMNAIFEAADKAGARPALSPVFSKFDALEASLNPAERDIVAGDLAKARKYVLEMGTAPAGSPKNSFSALNDLKSTLADDINYAADSGAKNGLRKQVVRILKDEVDGQISAQMGPDLANEFAQAKQSYGALKNAAKAIKGKTKTGADAIRALVEGADYAEPSLAGKFSALEHATKILQHGQDKALGNRFFSPSDYAAAIAAGLMHGGPLGALTGLGSAIAHKVIREKGSAVIATLADHISQTPQLAVAAQSFGQQLQKVAPSLGEYGPPLLQAFQHNPATALATHMTWAQANPGYAQAAQNAGFLPETPEEAAHASAKGAALAAVAHRLDAQNKRINSGIDAVFKGQRAAPDATKAAHDVQDFGAKRMRRDATDSHAQRMTEIRELAANPDALLERVSKNIGSVSEMAPGMTAAMTRTAHAAVQFLSQQSQTPPKAGPLASEWVATEAEIHEFALKLGAVQDPMSVLAHASAGTLVPAQMDAVRAVYPLLAAQIRDMALEKLADPPKDVPYRARLMLNTLTGIDPDGSMSQPAIFANQQTINSQSKKPSAPEQNQAKSAMTLAERMATPAQRNEMQREA